MRVLSTCSPDENTLQFKEIDHESTAYAIFSHTWEGEGFEVLYADVRDGSYTSKVGFGKVKSALRRAKKDGYFFMWIDNCCIDKSSSAELSEAINAMYRFYEKSGKCYAYLADVSLSDRSEDCWNQFSQARWWTRGWCLQELLAPKHLEFFANDWTAIGTKLNLKCEIFSITGIYTGYLDRTLGLESASIAQRMSWAASRETKRPEDIAYCLMGIFSVNMPMLYGEGKRAFLRLQKEIMNQSDDQSLFAWKDEDPPADPESFHGLLADHPRQFAPSGSIRSYPDWGSRKPYNMTNRGLSIELHLESFSRVKDVFAAALHCGPFFSRDGYLVLYLEKLPRAVDQYARVAWNRTGITSQRGQPKMIFVKQSFVPTPAEIQYAHHFFVMGTSKSGWDCYRVTEIIPEQHQGSKWTKHYPKSGAQALPWVSKGLPTVFSLVKAAGALTVAIITRRSSRLSDARPDIAILLGSISGHEPGFDDYELPATGAPGYSTFQECFKPHKMGTEMLLGAWRYAVTMEERDEDGQKIYSVDFFAASVDNSQLKQATEEPKATMSPARKAIAHLLALTSPETD